MLSSPLKYYCDKNAFRFHVLEVGEGLMILIIFPDNKVMLFDCNVTEDNSECILKYLEENIPYSYDDEAEEIAKIIHVFVNSHRDEDHYRGLKKVNEKFKIKSIWDSGQSGATTQSSDYEYYMRLRRKLKEANTDNLKVLVPTQSPIINIGGANVYCFSGKEDYQEDYDNSIRICEAFAKVQHTNSIVLKIEYGGTSLLLTGDSDWKAWKEKIIPNFLGKVKSEILIASHHGSRSFFTDEEENETIDVENNPDSTYIDSIDYIDPDIVLISCGDYNTYHHPNKEAFEIYGNKSENCQVYTTKSCGSFAGYIDRYGNYTVVPTRFKECRTASYSCNITINCKYYYNNTSYDVDSGSNLKVGGTLKFSVHTSGGILEPFDKVSVWWEVSNGGKWENKNHQEIYSKGSNEDDGPLSFKRELLYKGTHLLRCQFSNRNKGSITKIFSVTGI